jgi:hypothetical protein
MGHPPTLLYLVHPLKLIGGQMQLTYKERLRKQQLLITVYRWRPRKTNLCFLFSSASNKGKLAISIFRSQQRNASNSFPRVPFSIDIHILKNYFQYTFNIYIFGQQNYTYIYATVLNRKQKMEAQAVFLYLFIVCSSCKWKFVICLFVDEKQTDVIHLQTDGLKGLNKLNRLNGLWHLVQVNTVPLGG